MLVLVYSKHIGCMYHDFSQLVAFGTDVVHEHFVRCELVFNGQWVVLTLLNLLQLNTIP